MTVWWDVIKLKQHPVAYTTTPRNKPNRNAHTCPAKDMYENVHKSTIHSYPSEDGMLAPIRYGGGGLVTQSCPTLVTPWAVAHQVPLSMAFPQQEYWHGLSFPSPGDLSKPRIEPTSPELQMGFLLLNHQGSSFNKIYSPLNPQNLWTWPYLGRESL